MFLRRTQPLSSQQSRGIRVVCVTVYIPPRYIVSVNIYDIKLILIELIMVSDNTLLCILGYC